MNDKYLYDVAISFADEDIEAAKSLSLAFKYIGINAYYYPDNRASMLGQQLEERLTEIYAHEARYAVVLLSENYFDESKTYPKIELAAILSRMQQDPAKVYMIPVKLKKEFSVEKFPDIRAITYADWECKPETIAADINLLLGKKLANPTDVTDVNTVVYSSGANPLVIVDEEISSQNLTTLKKFGGGSVIVINRDAEEFKFSKLRKNYYPCPFCGYENEFEKYGINDCKKCKCTYNIINPDINVQQYKTLTAGDETREYNRIRARINNSIIDKDYEAAIKFCQAAERMAPAESATWEHYAITDFLLLIYTPAKERLSSKEILKEIKPHLEKCKAHEIPDEKLDGLIIEIANKLFQVEKARIGSLKASYTDKNGNEIWTKYNLAKVKEHLDSFEVCYNLMEKNIAFLREYVSELCKPYKWLVQTEEGEIMNTLACGNFRAADKFRSLVSRIQISDPQYTPPPIAIERIELLIPDILEVNSTQTTGQVTADGIEILTPINVNNDHTN